MKLPASALGAPPPDVVARAHDHGVLLAALAGSAHRSLRMDSTRAVRAVFDDLTRGFERAIERVNHIAGRA